MSNFKEIYPQKNFIEELHRMDSLKDDGYEVLAFNGVSEDAPLNAEYCYDLKKNTKMANGKEISVNDGINMPLESLKIFGETEYDRRGLPDEYIWLTYIKSTGAQYIDTKFKPNQNTRIICDFYMMNYNTGYRIPFGTRVGNNYQFLIGSARQNGRDDWYHRYGSLDTVSPAGNPSVEGIHHADLNKNYYTLDNFTHTFNSQTFQTDYNCYIFGVNASGNLSYASAMELYNFKIYDDDVLVRDFIPCSKRSDGKIGLYDIVNNQFYPNAGTGTFVAGPEVGDATMENPRDLDVIGTYNPLTQLWNTEITDGNITTILEHEQPLCGLGDECKDMYDNGMLCYKTQYKQLTDNLNWKVDNVYTNDSILAVSVLIPDAIKQTDVIYCTHFTPSTDMTQANHIKLDNSKFYLTIDKSIVSSLDDFLQWLRENKLVVIYNRKSVEKIPVIPYILLNTHEGMTTITNDQNADMEIEYRVGPNAILWHREENGEFVEVTE